MKWSRNETSLYKLESNTKIMIILKFDHGASLFGTMHLLGVHSIMSCNYFISFVLDSFKPQPRYDYLEKWDIKHELWDFFQDWFFRNNSIATNSLIISCMFVSLSCVAQGMFEERLLRGRDLNFLFYLYGCCLC